MEKPAPRLIAATAAWLSATVLVAACGLDPDDDGPAAEADVAVADTGGTDTADTRVDVPVDTVDTTDADEDADTDTTDVDAEDAVDAPDGSADAGTDTDAVDDELDVPTDTDPTSDPVTDADIADTAPDGPWLRVGTGNGRWRRPADDEVLNLAQGFQGGFHVWGAVAGAGFAPEDVELSFSATNADGTLVAAVYWPVTLARWGDQLEAADVTVFVSPEVEPESVVGQTWTLCATVDATDGVHLEDCTPIHVGCCDYLE